jgi:hypothetical protein
MGDDRHHNGAFFLMGIFAFLFVVQRVAAGPYHERCTSVLSLWNTGFL